MFYILALYSTCLYAIPNFGAFLAVAICEFFDALPIKELDPLYQGSQSKKANKVFISAI